MKVEIIAYYYEKGRWRHWKL